MNLAKEQALRYHRDMWSQLAKSGSKNKESVTSVGDKEAMISIREALNQCFCCECCNQKCYFCPVVWTSPDGLCMGDESTYVSWRESTSEEERKKYAKIISELPERT